MFCQLLLNKTHDEAGQNHKHSHVADMSQENADQAFVLSADVPLKRVLQPVLNVAHLHHAGVPANSQVAQRGSQHEVVPPQLPQGAEVE